MEVTIIFVRGLILAINGEEIQSSWKTVDEMIAEVKKNKWKVVLDATNLRNLYEKVKSTN